MSMQQIEEARQLLPWYITGKLSSTEAKLVKEALQASPTLYEEYETQRKLSQMIKKDPKLMEISAISTQEQRLNALMQRIRAEEPRVTAPVKAKAPSLLQQKLDALKHYFKENSHFSAKQWAFAAIASIVFVQVAWFSFSSQQEIGISPEPKLSSEDFSNSLIDPTTSDFRPSPAEEVKSIIIIFASTATAKEKQQILQTIDGRVVEPSNGGNSYTVIFSQPMSEKKANVLTNNIQKHRLVEFVGWGPD